MSHSIAQTLDRAMAALQAGQVAEAARLYGLVLAEDRKQFDALHMLGVIEAQRGNLRAGEQLLAEAVTLAPGHATAHLNHGVILEKLNRRAEALACYEQALACNPDYALAHFSRANVLSELKHFPDALAGYERALAIDPNLVLAHYNRGNVLQELGRHRDALAAYDQALRLNPQHAAAQSNRGNMLRELGRYPDAVESYDRALAIAPQSAPIHLNRGNTLLLAKRWTEALASFEAALAIAGGYTEAHRGRGHALHGLGRLREALASFDQALARDPADAEAQLARGDVLQDLKRWPEAIASYDRVLRANPRQPQAHSNRGRALHQLGRFTEALESCQQAVAIRPDDPGLHSNLGAVLQKLHRYTEALASHDRVLELAPGSAEAHSNRAGALEALGRFDEALAGYESALAIDPARAETHFDRGLLLLRLGDFERGLPEYEWRWRVPALSVYSGPFAQPAWLGEPEIAGKTVLLYADQGLGDTLQFVRYAPMVAARGARVILQVQKPLVGLLGGVRGVDQVVARGDPLPAFDLRCALASLPLACKTRVDTIPTEIPYLPVPPDHVEKWRARLPASGRLKVGLHWAGNAKYAKDDQRSILLSPLLPLLAASDATFFSLQNELREGDRELLQATPDIQHLGDDITPFEDAAAVVSLMDLIIASDTAIVHLAGALGKPVWVPLPFVPDWRWLRDREDSPWYPTVRLFRQPSAGDWTSVVERVGRELSSWHPN